MTNPKWARMEARRRAERAILMCASAGALHLAAVFIVARAAFSGEPIGLMEAGVASALFVGEIRLLERFVFLRHQVKALHAIARTFQGPRARGE